MRRRTYLGMVCMTAGIGLAGCLGDDNGGSENGDDQEGFDDPEDAARAYFAALNERDIETMNSLTHPDSPRPEVTDDDIEFLEEYAVEMEFQEIVQEDDMTVAHFEETLIDPETDEEMSFQSEVELRTHNGEWMIWRPELEG